MNRPRIGVFGVFGVGNFGNEATLGAYLSFVRALKPDVDIVCICAVPDVVEREYGLIAYSMDSRVASADTRTFIQRIIRRFTSFRAIAQMNRAIRTWSIIRSCDALVIPGTGILDDYGTTPDGLPSHLARWCRAARFSRVPVKFVSIGAGPIVNSESRRLMTQAIGLAQHRSYRDLESRQFVATLGIKTENEPVLPDLVFCHPHATRPKTRDASATIRVGVGVMSYYGWRGEADQGGQAVFDAYLKKITEFTSWLLSEGYEVRLLIGELSDHRAAEAVATVIAAGSSPESVRRLTLHPQTNMNEFLDQLERVDVAVVSRFHNLVGALCRGKPAISIAYATKNDRLMEDFALDAFRQHIDRIDGNQLRQQFGELTRRRVELAAQISARADVCKQKLTDYLTGSL